MNICQIELMLKPIHMLGSEKEVHKCFLSYKEIVFLFARICMPFYISFYS